MLLCRHYDQQTSRNTVRRAREDFNTLDFPLCRFEERSALSKHTAVGCIMYSCYKVHTGRIGVGE